MHKPFINPPIGHEAALDIVIAASRASTLSYEEAITVYLRATGILRDGARVGAAPIPEGWVPALIQDEVIYWREDATARLRTAVTLAKAAEAKGELDRAADIRVSIIMPTRAALTSALSGDIYYPLCEGCSKLLQPGDAVYQYEDVGEVHVDCEHPQLAGMPEEAHRYIEDESYSPEAIGATLADAEAYLNAEDGEG